MAQKKSFSHLADGCDIGLQTLIGTLLSDSDSAGNDMSYLARVATVRFSR